ncbi:MAG: hypothetical protein O7G31_12790 [Calditrichaeota bacterium]|nr:hypothetical protein [Calditrichota bacterium]
MKAFISSVQPNPISVQSGDTIILAVSATAIENISQARLVIVNKQPNTAELFDSNERADRVHSDRKDFSVGNNHLVHEIGFKLEQSNSTGAIIGVGIFIEDNSGTQVSPETNVLATIGA